MTQASSIKSMYLYHQFVTATFCHANWNRLSSNLFFVYIFGKLVEEQEGSFALCLSYIFSGAAAKIFSWLVLPRNAVSVGASGAVFGLFAINVLVKMSWGWRKILEVLILGHFGAEKPKLQLVCPALFLVAIPCRVSITFHISLVFFLMYFSAEFLLNL